MNKNTNISKYKNIFFIGIGGIGMSALARYFAVNGKNVAGYDKVSTELTNSLIKIGIAIHFNDDVINIPDQFLDKKNTLVVYTPAVSDNHSELQYFNNNGFTVLKRATILGLITKETFCFAVAGTHGKTTTSTILGHILKEANIDATSFLGGISVNYKSNLILGGDKISVVEADEYDRSFLQLSPDVACITSTDADHLDIYGKADLLLKSFNDFSNIVSDKLFVCYGINIKGITFGFDKKSDFQACNIRVINGISVFDVKTPNDSIDNVKIELPGKHNILNALAALSMANYYGVSLESIKSGLSTFKGIDRRFNIKIKSDKITLIDDYAHHPTEINAVFDTVKDLYPNKEKVVVFQPHLFSRTKDFANDFAASLAQFDKVILLEIYPARELPIENITSSWLANKVENITSTEVKVVSNDVYDVIKNIYSENNKVVAVLGAGDIDLLVGKLTKFYNEKISLS
ncbi:MAG TPA: UDP-N-acetylmuramate--L-alanine ligase [Flavobacteriaceae bacterium]|nr:UDP-N-acetylmuramate--L-alanine ligase [Flavobacteriaceae bacterium]